MPYLVLGVEAQSPPGLEHDSPFALLIPHGVTIRMSRRVARAMPTPKPRLMASTMALSTPSGSTKVRENQIVGIHVSELRYNAPPPPADQFDIRPPVASQGGWKTAQPPSSMQRDFSHIFCSAPRWRGEMIQIAASPTLLSC